MVPLIFQTYRKTESIRNPTMKKPLAQALVGAHHSPVSKTLYRETWYRGFAKHCGCVLLCNWQIVTVTTYSPHGTRASRIGSRHSNLGLCKTYGAQSHSVRKLGATDNRAQDHRISPETFHLPRPRVSQCTRQTKCLGHLLYVLKSSQRNADIVWDVRFAWATDQIGIKLDMQWHVNVVGRVCRLYHSFTLYS